MSFVFWSILSLITLVHSTILNCNDELSCTNSSIVNDDDIFCNGYKSCINNSLISTTDELWCNGGWTCSDTNTIVAKSLDCVGTRSCSYVNNITMKSVASIDQVHCRGANSCISSKFYQIPAAAYIACVGEWSCKDATLNNIQYLFLYAAYSAVGTSINTNESRYDYLYTTINIEYLGYFSGYNSTAYCWNGQTCNFLCKGNGCFGVTAICESGSTCSFNCDESENVYCPNSTYPNETFTILPYSQLSQANEHQILCESSINYNYSDGANINTTRCRDAGECWQDEIDLIDNGISDSICCAGDGGCGWSDLLSVNYNYDVIIVGGEGVLNSDIKGRGVESNSTVYCDSYEGCNRANISNVELVHCGGEFGCYETSIYTVDTIICSGSYSCNFAQIHNPTTVYSTARFSLTYARIYTHEYNCDSLTDSTSIEPYLNIMTVRLLAETTANGLNVYCYYGNLCNIECEMSDACVDTYIHCFTGAICNVTCYSDDSNCPQIFYNNSRSITCSPTLQPTSTTMIPTEFPTHQPTNATLMPTYLPSTIPTNLPTARPTSPTNMPSLIPSLTPTQIPTTNMTDEFNDDSNKKALAQLAEFYNFFLVLAVSFLFSLLVTTFLDAKCVRPNEQYNASGILYFGTYTLDFVSGKSVCGVMLCVRCLKYKINIIQPIVCATGRNISYKNVLPDTTFFVSFFVFFLDYDNKIDAFFVIELWFSGGIESNRNNEWILFLFPFGCLFIILPLIANLYQLNNAIKDWIVDNDTRHILQPWFLRYGKILYLLTIVCGSAFTGVELCDTHMFQLPIFSLDIPKRQKQIFKNKRIYSVVLMENIPQICLQITYLYLIGNSSSSNNSIALIAMCLSILSVILTLFEYNMRKFVMDTEYVMIIKFIIDSPAIRQMTPNEWTRRVSNKRNDINRALSKTLSLDVSNIDQLKPIPCSEGAMISCHVRCDITRIQTKTAMDLLQKSITSHQFPTVCTIVIIFFFVNVLCTVTLCLQHSNFLFIYN